LPNKPVHVEVNLPIIVAMAIRPQCKHGTGQVKLQDLDVWGGTGHDIRDSAQLVLEKSNGGDVICAMRKLS
jgi:hypothetical protein